MLRQVRFYGAGVSVSNNFYLMIGEPNGVILVMQGDRPEEILVFAMNGESGMNRIEEWPFKVVQGWNVWRADGKLYRLGEMSEAERARRDEKLATLDFLP